MTQSSVPPGSAPSAALSPFVAGFLWGAAIVTAIALGYVALQLVNQKPDARFCPAIEIPNPNPANVAACVAASPACGIATQPGGPRMPCKVSQLIDKTPQCVCYDGEVSPCDLTVGADAGACIGPTCGVKRCMQVSPGVFFWEPTCHTVNP